MGMIARKDTLMKYGVFPNERMRRDVCAMIYGIIRKNRAAEHRTRQECQKFTIFPNITIFFDIKRLCGKQACFRRAIEKERYSIGTSYSKRVIILPPFLPQNRSYQEDCYLLR